MMSILMGLCGASTPCPNAMRMSTATMPIPTLTPLCRRTLGSMRRRFLYLLVVVVVVVVAVVVFFTGVVVFAVVAAGIGVTAGDGFAVVVVTAVFIEAWFTAAAGVVGAGFPLTIRCCCAGTATARCPAPP